MGGGGGGQARGRAPTEGEVGVGVQPPRLLVPLDEPLRLEGLAGGRSGTGITGGSRGRPLGHGDRWAAESLPQPGEWQTSRTRQAHVRGRAAGARLICRGPGGRQQPGRNSESPQAASVLSLRTSAPTSSVLTTMNDVQRER